MERLYDIYDTESNRLIGPKKQIRQVKQLFGEEVAALLIKSDVADYGKYRIEKHVEGA